MVNSLTYCLLPSFVLSAFWCSSHASCVWYELVAT